VVALLSAMPAASASLMAKLLLLESVAMAVFKFSASRDFRHYTRLRGVSAYQVIL